MLQSQGLFGNFKIIVYDVLDFDDMKCKYVVIVYVIR